MTVRGYTQEGATYLPGTAAAPETPTPDFRWMETGGAGDLWLTKK